MRCQVAGQKLLFSLGAKSAGAGSTEPQLYTVTLSPLQLQVKALSHTATIYPCAAPGGYLVHVLLPFALACFGDPDGQSVCFKESSEICHWIFVEALVLAAHVEFV